MYILYKNLSKNFLNYLKDFYRKLENIYNSKMNYFTKC
uniref:Uncharacterized protein n=1 Tax=viral metagenome TaxID=1070528 RepID=A0A6C0AEX2_9ZZZZ